ncbi:MAG: DedA family protein [Chloroflexota bacterium]|nr:MAG: hypothetical protein DLM70_12205 [Chloroflexota bacterium]
MPALIAQYGLIVVGLIIFCGEIGLPTLIPGEIALLIAGSQAVHSAPALVAAVAAFGTVDILATTTIHVVFRTGGNRVLLRLLRRLHRSNREAVVERWRSRLGGRDAMVVFVTRLIPMFRLYASITTGLIRIRLRHFFGGAIPAAYVWAATPLTLGYVLRSRIHGLESQYGLMMHVLVLVSVLAAVLAGSAWWVRRNSSSTDGLCRIRVILALVVVFGVCARMTLALLGNGVGYAQFVIPPLSTLAVWTSVLSVLALGLLWLASLDVRRIRAYAYSGRMGSLLGVTWMGLIVMIIAFTGMVGVHSPAV